MKFLLTTMACIYLASALPLSLIKEYSITPHRIEVTCNDKFQQAFLREPFFAEYSSIDLTTLDETIALVPFLLNVMPIIWYSNQTFTIDAMDAELYASLEKIRSIFKQFWPQVAWDGKLIPGTLITNQAPTQKGMGVLFSGGVDAVCASMTHYNEPQLLICIAGGDIPLHKNVMWQGVQKNINEYARIYEKECAYVRSNFWTNINSSALHKNVCHQGRWWATTTQGMGYAGLALPLVYAHGYTNLTIGSSLHIEYPYAYGTHPAIDNLIRCGSIYVHHENEDLLRTEKLARIASVCTKENKPYPLLRVCWGKDPNGSNCSSCRKCINTTLGLIVEGLDPAAFGLHPALESLLPTAQKAFLSTTPSSAGRWQWKCLIDSWIAQKYTCTACPDVDHLLEWLSLQDFSDNHPEHARKIASSLWLEATGAA